MARRKGWPQDLAERCEAVGWTVAYGKSGHFKATRPDGQILSWPSTPSGTNSEQNVRAKARKMGLDEAENKARLRAERARLQKILDDRESNGVPEHQMIESEKKEMPPMKETAPTLGWVEVEGTRLAIAEVAVPVMHQHPRGGDPRPLPHAEELLLVDGSVRYRCRRGTGGWAGDAEILCERHFETTGGLVVHWARGVHSDPEPKVPPRAESPKAEPPARSVTIEKVPAPRPGVAARLESLGERLQDLHFEAQRVANLAQGVHQDLMALAPDLTGELASDELRAKAAKFDRMMGAIEK